MKVLITLLTATLLTACVASSTSGTRKSRHADRYVSFFQPGEEVVASSYLSVLTKTPEGDFVSRTFFPETKQLIEEYQSTDALGKDLKGLYQSWWDNGNKKSVGRYESGKREGQWTNYNFDEGAKSEEGNYLAGKQTGEWLRYDGEERKKILTYFDSGEKTRQISYDSTGAVVTDFRINDGEIVEALVGEIPGPDDYRLPLFSGCESLQSEGYEAMKKCADKKMLEFIYSSIRYPARARENGVQGMAIARFVVEESGKIQDVDILRGLNQDIAQEVRRVVSSMPKWIPGKQDGKVVRVQFNLPVKFKLE